MSKDSYALVFVHLEIALDILVQTCVKASLFSILEVISEGNWIV